MDALTSPVQSPPSTPPSSPRQIASLPATLASPPGVQQIEAATDRSPLFESLEAIRQAPSVTYKGRFEKTFSKRTLCSVCKDKETITSLNQSTIRSIPQAIKNHGNGEPIAYSDDYLNTLFQMPKGVTKTMLLLSLLGTARLTKEQEFRCLLCNHDLKRKAQLIKAFDQKHKGLLLNWAQDTTKDANFRAQCILHTTGNIMRKLTREKLLKELINNENLVLKYQVELSLLLENEQLKKEHLKRLAKETSLSPKYRIKCIFHFHPGDTKDELITNYIETPDLDVKLKVPAVAFIKNDKLRNDLLMKFYNEHSDNVHARTHCVICLDASEERSRMREELEPIPEAKKELDKVDAILRMHYPYIQNLETITISQKITALYTHQSPLAIVF